jgi:hypothetical protein
MHENLHARFAKLARTKLAIFDVAIHLKTAVFQISRKFQKMVKIFIHMRLKYFYFCQWLNPIVSFVHNRRYGDIITSLHE